MRQYYVYIMVNYRGTLYTGVTNDLVRPDLSGHKLISGFTTKYNISKLVYYEATGDITSAICREKQVKGWLRSKKVALIESTNPYWVDLAEEWDRNPTASPDPSSRLVGTLRTKYRSPQGGQGDRETCTSG